MNKEKTILDNKREMNRKLKIMIWKILIFTLVSKKINNELKSIKKYSTQLLKILTVKKKFILILEVNYLVTIYSKVLLI